MTGQKTNGAENEIIIDTGSKISIIPLDNKILKETKIHKVKHRYQDVNQEGGKSGEITGRY